MRGGDWAAAWAVSDVVLRARGTPDWTRPRHLQAVWDGTPLQGRRVLVRCYHGLGDTIQIIRLVPQVGAARGDGLGAAGSTPVADHLARTRTAAANARWHAGDPFRRRCRGDGTGTCAADYAGNLTGAGTLPASAAYGPARPRPACRAGVASRSWDDRRSVPVALLRPLADIPGVTLHILQRGAPCPGFGVPAGADDILEMLAP